jgi:tetratricopeptide (TPR) repeat protein
MRNEYTSSIIIALIIAFGTGIARGQNAIPSGQTAYADELVANSIRNWGDGTSADAEQALQKALLLRQATLPQNDPKIAEVQNRLGRIYYNRGLLGDASSLKMGEHLFSSALSEAQQSLEPNDLVLADYYGDEGAALREMHFYAQAIANVCKSLAIRRSKLGPIDQHVAWSLHNLALIAWRQGNLSDEVWLEAGATAIENHGGETDDPGRRALREFCPPVLS